MTNTADRVLAVLRLFSMQQPEWTVEAAARELNLSQSTAYQYFRSLVEARLLVAFKAGRYVIGPAIIEFDRQTRRLDPLIRGAEPTMRVLSEHLGGEGVSLLCRIYGFTVMCVDQRAVTPPSFAVSYERGRPMPLFRGAASKVILAYLAQRSLRRHYDQVSDAIAAAGLGEDWTTFKATLRKIRKQGFCVTRGELDTGLVGISAPVFAPEGDILGSVGVVVTAKQMAADAAAAIQLIDRVRGASQEVTAALASAAADTP